MLLDVSAALHYLHSQHPAFVHGDLKPENILVDRHWVAKLTDFGLARRSATRDKMPGGTRKWLEPCLRATTKGSGVHESVDIWALGGIAFFVWAGVGPWEGNTVRGSRSVEMFGATVFELWRGDLDEEDVASKLGSKQHTRTDVEDLKYLSALCYKCMDSDPYERPTARDVHQEVLSWQSMGKARSKNLLMSHGDAQRGDSNNLLLDEQIAAVRTRVSERWSRAKCTRRPVEIPVDVLNEIRGVLCQQCACLQGLLRSDSHDHQSLYIMQMLLASVFQEKGFVKTGVSLCL
eukprot:TRINITY_DN12440_c0_g2_i1.p1 TRINITY_DN12440_c0_g2~~TRINITY_DN12440_c0_g2_i1.p1  ORF type:complete len:291 (+),score=25.37 TRINITY_DN12440_c0_g2_i1:220-1092(+)